MGPTAQMHNGSVDCRWCNSHRTCGTMLILRLELQIIGHCTFKSYSPCYEPKFRWIRQPGNQNHHRGFFTKLLVADRLQDELREHAHRDAYKRVERSTARASG